MLPMVELSRLVSAVGKKSSDKFSLVSHKGVSGYCASRALALRRS